MDHIANADLKVVCREAFFFLSKVQAKDPHVIVSAAATFFSILCRHYALSPRKVLELNARLIELALEKNSDHLLAMDDFLQHEL